MKYILMLKASTGSLAVTEVLAKRIDKTCIHFGGRKARLDNGYIKYFQPTEWKAAKEWIVKQRGAWTTKPKVTMEQIDEQKNEDISDKERAAGKLSRNEKRNAIGGVRANGSGRGRR